MKIGADNTSSTLKDRGEGVGFERIRRITGYLVGGMDRWGTGKRNEEQDRVKHGAYSEQDRQIDVYWDLQDDKLKETIGA